MKDPISNHLSKILYRIKLLNKSKGHTGRISLINDIDLSYNVIILIIMITGNRNTLWAIKINVLLFACVPVSFLSCLAGIWMKRRQFTCKFRVMSLTINSHRLTYLLYRIVIMTRRLHLKFRVTLLTINSHRGRGFKKISLKSVVSAWLCNQSFLLTLTEKISGKGYFISDYVLSWIPSQKLECVIPENIHTSTTEGIFSGTPLEIPPASYISLNFLALQDPHPLGNSNLFRGGSTDTFWNCTIFGCSGKRSFSRKSRVTLGSN